MSLGPLTNELEDGAATTPFSAPVEDSVIGSQEDQQRQREAMERQVRSQSSALDPKAVHGEHTVAGAAPTPLAEQERIRGESLTEEQLLTYRGKPLVDAHGEEIGPISCVYLDEATGVPKWLGAQVGSLMGSKRVVAPVFGSYIFRDIISVPYARKALLDAEIATPDAITPEQDGALFLHFGIPMSTDHSPSGLPAGLHPIRVKRLERWLNAPLAQDLRGAGGRVRGLVGRLRLPWTRPA